MDDSWASRIQKLTRVVVVVMDARGREQGCVVGFLGWSFHGGSGRRLREALPSWRLGVYCRFCIERGAWCLPYCDSRSGTLSFGGWLVVALWLFFFFVPFILCCAL